MQSRILLIESNPTSGEVLKSTLEKQEFEVVLVEDLPAAFESLELEQPDALVLDLDSEDMNWRGFLSWVRQSFARSEILCVLIGSQTNPELEALSNDPHSMFLQKPLKRKEFIASIKESLESGRALKREFSEDGEEHSGQSFLNAWSRSLRGRTLGSVVLEKEIGRGGMGVVWKGTQLSLNREVAVKILLPQMTQDASTIKRFKREALETAKLKSPHIVQIFESGTTEDHLFYIVMEWLEGKNLEQLLHDKKRYSLVEAIDVIKQTAQGLIAAHTAGLIHRDLKPSNLIVSGDGHVTITDFGIVLNKQASRYTQTGSVMGTPYYMSPEQARSREITARSDLYSLGILFYELLTGQLPFFSMDLLDLLLAHTSSPLPNPQEIVPDIPDELVTVLRKMTAKDPERRYEDAATLVNALETVQTTLATAGSALHRTALQEVHLHEKVSPMSVEPPTSPVSGVVKNIAYLAPGTLHRQLQAKDHSTLSMHSEEWVQWGLDGLMEMDWYGSLLRQFGAIDADWGMALSILLGHHQQIQTAMVQEEWAYSTVDTSEASFFMSPTEEGVLGLLRPPPPHTTGAFSLENLHLDPDNFQRLLPSLYALAGVRGVMLWDGLAQLTDARLEPDVDLGDLQLKLGPMIHTLQALPWGMIQLQCRFADGVVRFWAFGDTFLVVQTAQQCNQSLLSMMVKRHLSSPSNSNPPTEAVRVSSTPPPAPVEEEFVSRSREMFVQTPPGGQTPAPAAAVTSAPVTGSLPETQDRWTGRLTGRMTGRLSTGTLQLPTEGFVSPQTLTALQQEYTRYAGPIAGLVINKAISTSGFPRDGYPMQHAPYLLEQMAARISLEKQSKFLRTCHEIILQQEGITR